MENQYLLELYHINRRISSEFYLRNITLTLQSGEVQALVGRNASGKSTLLSLIMGLYPPDSGEIRVDGASVQIKDPSDAGKFGIMLVGQNQKLFENLSVYENIFFGQELKVGQGLPVISNKKMLAAAKEVFMQMQVAIDPQVQVMELTTAERQLVAIARAIVSNAKVILLDEPSTHLNDTEKKVLFDAIASLKSQGKGFLIVSHDLEEVMAIADTVSVMESGELVRNAPIGVFDKTALIEATYGIKVEQLYHKEKLPLGEELLRTEQLSGEGFSDVNLCLHRHEIVALLGEAQSGKTEFARALAGLVKSTGHILLHQIPITLTSPISAVRAGLVLANTIADEEEIYQSEQAVNAGKQDSRLSRMQVGFRLFCTNLGKTFAPYIGTRSQGQYVTGGNRQRELIERTMRKQAQVYILCEPSAGVDIPARMRIYYEMSQLLQKDAGILLVTTDIEEALGLADRIVLLTTGGVMLDAPVSEVTRPQLTELLGK